jgi:RimJ/RimL family protein N-acetyltransferase
LTNGERWAYGRGSMEPFEVRLATPGDVEAIARLTASMGADALASPELGVNERIERLRGLIEAGRNVHFVAEASGEVVGELTLTLNDPGPASLGFSVRPEWRRRGVASALIKEAVVWARSHELHKLYANVFPENEAALALLEKHGFREEGRLKAHVRRLSGEPRDVVALGRILA